jgi:PAS domain S-box-containing protein
VRTTNNSKAYPSPTGKDRLPTPGTTPIEPIGNIPGRLSKPDLLWRSDPPALLSYAVTVLSVAVALIIARLLDHTHLVSAPVSLFLCAIMFSAWFGGVRPGLFAVALSLLAFVHYFVTPIYSLYLPIDEIPRVIIFLLSALFVGWLSSAQRSATQSLRIARDDLSRTVQELRRINQALQAENAERQRADNALRRSEDYLAEAQRLSLTGSFGWNTTGGEIFWSEETFRIFQYERTTKPTVELILQRVHPDDVAFVRQTIDRASQAGTDFDFEYRLLMPDGLVKHVHVVAHALSDESGGIEFVGAVMDVTGQHQSRAALEKAFGEIKKSESRLQLVIDTIPGMVWSGLPDGSFDFVNEPWLRYLGCTWEELSARGGLRSVVHPDDLEGSDARWSATRAAGRHIDHELRMRRADGQYRWFLTRALPLRDDLGNIVKWYGTATDIEDRKRAEAGLREQASLLNLTHDTIFVRDMNDVITYWNRGAEQLYGWTADRALGQVSHQLTQTMFPSPIDQINAEVLQTGRWEGTLVHTKRDGTQVVVASRWSLQRDEQGQPATILETNNDITERELAITDQKRAEEALRQAQADLAHVSRVTTMGELTASLAHEVNQPITAAVTNANTCLRWLTRDEPDLEEARAAAARIVKDGTRAGEIISRIRLLFRKGTPEREQVDVNEVIREMLVILHGEVTRYAISVRTELAGDIPQFMGDRVQLQQVVMNLIMNSIDAMKDVEGTRELAIKSGLAKNEQVLVSVSDTGVGLPREQVDQIFNAFVTTKLHGTGMGLSISRSIVESHGGRLWAADNSPHGASFCFTLPTKVEAPE